MRSFTPPANTRFYASVDLHARALFLVVLDRDGKTVFARNLPAAAEPFLHAVAPFRDGLLVACECMHCWYWLADTCRDEKIAFVLGHAWGMKAVHGNKTKCDKHDAERTPMASASAITRRCHWTVSPRSACPGPQPRQPADWTGRRPFLIFCSRRIGCGAGVGRGTKRDQREAVPRKRVGAESPPKVHPTPAAVPAVKGENRLTTRPGREARPNGTLPKV